MSLSDAAERAIGRLARRDEVPEATKAAELIERALEIEEDEVWDAIARSRDKRRATFVTHARAWKV